MDEKTDNPREQEFKAILYEHSYDLISQIGHGGYASVYIVNSHQYHVDFVAKIINIADSNKYGLVESFKSEISALTRLRHQNIISIFDHFTTDNFLFLILEYCPNGTLNDKIKLNGELPKDQLYQYCYQVLKALNYCHMKGIAHRDIKPSNIFIDKYDRVKLADFGFASISNHQFSESYVGSLAFIPLEILHLVPYDPIKADIWSLGVTFYVLATGQYPFLPKSSTYLAMLIATREPEYPETLDPEFVDILKRMLKIKPAERPSVTEILSMQPFKNFESQLYPNAKRREKSRTLINRNIIASPRLTPRKPMRISSHMSVGSFQQFSLGSKPISLSGQTPLWKPTTFSNSILDEED